MVFRKIAWLFFLLLVHLATVRPSQAQMENRPERLLSWANDHPVYTLMATGSAGPPSSDFTGSIRGLVRAAGNEAPISQVEVFAKQTDSLVVELYDITTGELRGEAPVILKNPAVYRSVTNADGRYEFDGLTPGMYNVWAGAENSPYRRQFFPDHESVANASALEITRGETIAGIDFNLVLGGSISGQVSRQADNLPIPDLRVSIIDPRTNSPIATSTTNQDGTYLLQGLAAGAYKVRTEKSKLYVDSYHAASDQPAEALLAMVQLGQPTDHINIAVRRYGSISGTVQADTAAPLPAVRIKAYLAEGTTNRLLAQASTDQNGNYLLTGLPPGNYTVLAEAVTNHISEFFKEAASAEQATALRLTDGEVLSNIDFSLAAGGTITGVINKAETGQPLAAVEVKAFDISTGTLAAMTKSRQDGSFSLERLNSGAYRVGAYSSEYLASFFDHTPEQDLATPVMVTAGQLQSNINLSLTAVSLSQAGAIAGRIYWQLDNTMIERACVTAYDAVAHRRAGEACSGADGTYFITPLAAGEYQLCVRVAMGRIFIGECYDNVPATSPALAATIAIPAGQQVNGIDFGLAKIGSITGTVSRAADLIEIGSYEVKNIPGAYHVKVRATNSGYLGKYYQDALTVDTAAPVSIIDGQPTSAIDFSLTAADLAAVAAGAPF